MPRSHKVEPSEKIHIFKKRIHQMRYFYIKKLFLLLEKKQVVYPLTVFLLVLVLFGHIYSLIGKPKPFPNQQVATKTSEHVSDFFLTASITIIILYLPKNSENFYQFFNSLYPEGNKLLGPLLAMKKHHFWRNFFICNLCIGILIGLNASFFMINFGWHTYKYFIFRDIEFYLYNLVLLLLLTLARKLEMRFSEINELLEYKTENYLKTRKTKKKFDNELDKNLSFILSSEHFYSVRTFRIMHYDLCNLIKRFNEMFGRIMLLTVVFSISNILARVTFVIDFYITQRSEKDEAVWLSFLSIVCLWILVNMGQSFLLSYYGEQLIKEGEKTTRICFYLLNKVSFNPKCEDEKLVEDELKLFAFQSYSHIPCLSAGGFFDINFKVLGLLISSVTSYLMVIIQFLLRQTTN